MMRNCNNSGRKFAVRNVALGLAAATVLAGGSAMAAIDNHPWQGVTLNWTGGDGTSTDWNHDGNWSTATSQLQATAENGTMLLYTNYAVYLTDPTSTTFYNPMFNLNGIDPQFVTDHGIALGGNITVKVPGNTRAGSTTLNRTTNNNTYDNVTFNTADNLQVNVDAGRTIRQITFGANAGDYTFNGEKLYVYNLISGSKAGTITFNAPVQILGDANLSPATGQTFDFKGGYTAQAGQRVFFSTGGTVNINGPMASSSLTGAMYFTLLGGSPTLNLNYEGTAGGGTFVQLTTNNATVNVTAEHALIGAGGINNVFSGGKVYVTAKNGISGTAQVNVGTQYGAGQYALVEVTKGQDYSSDTKVGNTAVGMTAPQALLLANNDSGSATGSSEVIVNIGTLGGDGAIDNSTNTKAGGAGVTLNAGANLSPGAAAGAVGTLTLTTGAKGVDITGAVAGTGTGALIFDLGSFLSGSSDQVVLGEGTLLKFGADTLEFDDFVFNPLAGFGVGEYTLFLGGAGAIAGGLGGNVSGLIGDFTGTLSIDDNHQAILLTVVPEPASLSVLALGAMGLLARRRKVANR